MKCLNKILSCSISSCVKGFCQLITQPWELLYYLFVNLQMICYPEGSVSTLLGLTLCSQFTKEFPGALLGPLLCTHRDHTVIYCSSPSVINLWIPFNTRYVYVKFMQVNQVHVIFKGLKCVLKTIQRAETVMVTTCKYLSVLIDQTLFKF